MPAKKRARKPAKRKAASKKKRKPNAAFMKPLMPSAALSEVVGARALPRTEVTKKLWAYIKKNKLQDKLVVVRDLEFHSLCVHHFVPFFGHAHVAYLPGQRIVGVSGPARLLDFYARRPQLQERISQQIADHLERVLSPRGLAVTLEARHLCMEMRGIRKRGTVVTRVRRGALADPAWAAQLP